MVQVHKWRQGDALKRQLVNDMKNWIAHRNLIEVDGVEYELEVTHEGSLLIEVKVSTDDKPPRYFEFKLAERY